MDLNRGYLTQQILSNLRHLPDEALREVNQFVEYQRYKAARDEPTTETPYTPVALGGLFPDWPDLSEEEIDEARREMWCGSGEQES